MSKKLYPDLRDESPSSVGAWIREVTRIRREGVGDFNNLSQLYIMGRKVGKVPTAYDDVADSDREGDFNFDNGYIYLLVDDSGTLKWARTAHGSISW